MTTKDKRSLKHYGFLVKEDAQRFAFTDPPYISGHAVVLEGGSWPHGCRSDGERDYSSDEYRTPRAHAGRLYDGLGFKGWWCGFEEEHRKQDLSETRIIGADLGYSASGHLTARELEFRLKLLRQVERAQPQASGDTPLDEKLIAWSQALGFTFIAIDTATPRIDDFRYSSGRYVYQWLETPYCEPVLANWLAGCKERAIEKGIGR